MKSTFPEGDKQLTNTQFENDKLETIFNWVRNDIITFKEFEYFIKKYFNKNTPLNENQNNMNKQRLQELAGIKVT